MTIWKLVEQCAKELTANGISPFTRVNIIKCVQQKNPSYRPDSINPIIQGLTDNLKGGAPGAVGKNILHSAGRGLFVLAGENSIRKQVTSDSYAQKPRIEEQHIVRLTLAKKLLDQLSNVPIRKIENYDFFFIVEIEPDKGSDGQILTFMPQDRFDNPRSISLHKYGNGPFCRFKIQNSLDYPGVYTLMDAECVLYIGECINLSSRYNMGYGNISPRNCFEGGQPTNCRINNLILLAKSAGSTISLWFLPTSNNKDIKSQLRTSLRPSWNRI